MPLLELQGITKNFGATAALGGVDLVIEPGEVHALIGENGAGKSTLMNILSGAFPPDSGAMRFNGQPYAPRSPIDARAKGIAHIHQELSLCLHMTVAENISLGLEPQRLGIIDRAAMRERARTLLEDFGCSHISPNATVASLAIPDQQVVEICRALAGDARIILMDEPTSSLSRQSVEQLFHLVRRLSQQGIAIIYISHFLEEVREVARRFTVLRDGKSVASGELQGISDDGLISHMVGHERESADIFGGERAATRVPGNALLHVANLASPPKVRSASFELHRGEILGIGGLVGSGRTELVRALFGLAPFTGVLQVEGKRISSRTAADQINNGIGYLSEDRKHEGLCLQLSVADNLTATAPIAHAGWIDFARQGASSEKIISALNIRSAQPRVPVVRLSGGNQQKVAFGRLLHQNADILLLDEPTRGIDIRSKADIYREIHTLADSGKAILMVSSYLPELLGVCDRIAVMCRGVLSPARDVDAWTPHSIMEAAISESAPTEAR
jgi:ribose transport system ATP-binding protein